MACRRLPQLEENNNVDMVPSLNLPSGFPTFDYGDVKKVEEIGRGSFGTVFVAKYKLKNVVVKEMIIKRLEERERKLFVKEAKLLNSLHHENIVKFHAISLSPPALLMDYVYFTFKPFSRDVKVSSVQLFLREICDNCDAFSSVIPKVALDVTRGLMYLHNQGVVHRDLKPANILISNQHYCDLKNAEVIGNMWLKNPVICKLTDFGESRSELIRTQTLGLTSRNIVYRGTPTFMAPEISLPELVKDQQTSLDFLKRVDMWALGLTFYNLINPSVSCPYMYDLEKANVEPSMFIMFIHNRMRNHQLPSSEPKYAKLQSTTWKTLNHVFKRCASFDPSSRPTASEILECLLPKSYLGVVLMRGAKKETRSAPTLKIQITTLMENKDHNIRKITVGKPSKDSSGPGKVLMLVGATGSGKSTLINGFVNYIMGVRYEDDHRYKLIDNEGAGFQAHSQTKWITAYTFYKGGGLPYTLTIINTPGFGNTEWLERDRQITKQIKEFFSMEGEQGIDQLNGIGFVVKAPDSRLTPTQMYIFDSILSIFGKDIAKNIFMMITFADGNEPPVLAAIKEAKIEFQKHFKLNNSALYGKNDSDDEETESPSFNEMFWKMGEKSLMNFFRVFNEAKSVSLQLTKEVLDERARLECLIQGIHRKTEASLLKADELQQEKRVAKRHEKDLLANKYFEYKVDVTKQRKLIDLPPGEHVTNCIVCNMTCHYPCKIPLDKDKAGCEAMDITEKHCTVCPGNCHWSQHYNNTYRSEVYTEEEMRTSEELKTRYRNAASKMSTLQLVTSGLERDIGNLNTAIAGMITDFHSNSTIQRLDEIALRPNPMTSIQYIDLLIISENVLGKKGFIKQLHWIK